MSSLGPDHLKSEKKSWKRQKKEKNKFFISGVRTRADERL